MEIAERRPNRKNESVDRLPAEPRLCPVPNTGLAAGERSERIGQPSRTDASIRDAPIWEAGGCVRTMKARLSAGHIPKITPKDARIYAGKIR